MANTTPAVNPNPIGTAGGVLGIVTASVSLIFSWFLPWLIFLMAVIATALSGVGLKRAIEGGTPRGMSITGLSTAIPTLVWSVFWSVVLTAAISTSGSY
jgi:hypothetical protein